MELKKEHIAYFASDFHLGTPDNLSSKDRENEIIEWLNFISIDATHLFLVGDIFDFWFEYKHVIPKGFVKLQAKIGELVDKGIEVHLFHGNHNMWMFDYFKTELGVKIHSNELIIELNGELIYISHGDGIGPGDRGYKFIKRIFRNKLCQWLFARVHPNFGIGLAKYFSTKSRKKTGHLDEKFDGIENEWIYQYILEQHFKINAKTYIFGHRHLHLHIKNDTFQYFNLGEWLHHNSYVRFSLDTWQLLQWKSNKASTLPSSHLI